MSDVILAAYHGGLGDNLQFSTLPEEFHKQQGRDTYIWSQASFRNQEIYDLVWGHNPYVKGIKDGEWSAGDTPNRHSTILQNGIANWEVLHDLKPTNKYPKIYYKPEKVDAFNNVILVDLSSISWAKRRTEAGISMVDEGKKILDSYESIKKKHEGKTFLGVEFTQNVSGTPLIEPDVTGIVEIESIFSYVDLIYSSFGVISLHSGQSVLAASIKNDYNNDLEIYCIMDEDEYQDQKRRAIYVFDNVTYSRY